MSKKFTKTVLSTALAGVLACFSFNAQAQDVGNYSIQFIMDNKGAFIFDKNKKVGIVNTETGSIMSYNENEMKNAYTALIEKFKGNVASPDFKKELQDIANKISFPVYSESLKLESLKKINENDLKKVLTLKDDVSKVITSANAEEYLKTVKSGGNTEAYLAINKTSPALSKEYSRISGNIEQLNKDTTFAIDADGNITLDETAGTGERYGVKDVVADLVADTTVYAEEDGSLTMDNSAPARKRVNEALVDLDKSVRERTTVGVSSDGTLTRAEGAKNTISVNDGLVALSGRTDRIDAAV
ncbi:hypothetical protein EG801_24320, partial [Escherichia coli]|nr:hypothetical protein [Escherichia coli]